MAYTVIRNGRRRLRVTPEEGKLLTCLHAYRCDEQGYHETACYLSRFIIPVDKHEELCYPALDLNGQGAPAKSGSSRPRRRTSEKRSIGA